MLEVLAIVWLVQATPDKNFTESPLHGWFKSLRQPKAPFGICCDVSDCHTVDARTLAGHWQAEIKGDWVHVPDEVILKDTDNPTGRAVACYSIISDGLFWFCFVTPPMI